MSKALGRFTFALRMTLAGRFIADLQKERRIGNVSSETEQHLKREFRRLGWEAPDATLAVVIDSEIHRLEREAAALRKLRASLFEGDGGGRLRVPAGSGGEHDCSDHSDHEANVLLQTSRTLAKDSFDGGPP
jgi:hypothetical protein